MEFTIDTKFDIYLHHYFDCTVVFWGSEMWLEIFAQNRGFIVLKAGKWMNSED